MGCSELRILLMVWTLNTRMLNNVLSFMCPVKCRDDSCRPLCDALLLGKQQTGSHLAINTVSHPSGVWSSVTALWEPETSQEERRYTHYMVFTRGRDVLSFCYSLVGPFVVIVALLCTVAGLQTPMTLERLSLHVGCRRIPINKTYFLSPKFDTAFKTNLYLNMWSTLMENNILLPALYTASKRSFDCAHRWARKWKWIYNCYVYIHIFNIKENAESRSRNRRFLRNTVWVPMCDVMLGV